MSKMDVIFHMSLALSQGVQEFSCLQAGIDHCVDLGLLVCGPDGRYGATAKGVRHCEAHRQAFRDYQSLVKGLETLASYSDAAKKALRSLQGQRVVVEEYLRLCNMMVPTEEYP